VTGTSYHDLVKRKLFAAVGMDDSSNSAEEASENARQIQGANWSAASSFP